MKERFATIDLMSVLFELRERVLGMRLAKVYDIDSKTYLLKMGRSDEKVVILFQSGARIHLTEFSWPKNMMPSGFSMKCRKHLHNKRLVDIRQLGVDRIADLQFGSDHAAQHLIVELYDRGNVVLTDQAYCILGLLRPRTDSDSDVRFAVGEQYPVELARQERTPPTKERLEEILAAAQPGQPIQKVLSPHCEYSSALIGHCLVEAGFDAGVKLGKGFKLDEDVDRLVGVLEACRAVFRDIQTTQSKGYIIQKVQSQPTLNGTNEVTRNEEFHPMLFHQHKDKQHREFPTVNQAVDEFFSTLETQKIDQRTHHMEKDAVKKVKNVERDHERRLVALQQTQEEDKRIAELIELNIDLVERACLVIRSAVASSLAWEDIAALVKDAQTRRDPVAMVIHKLKLNEGLVTLLLSDPYDSGEEGSSPQPTKVDIDLELTAFANARRYYHHKLHAAEKEQRTIQASAQALKSAKKKAREAMKEVAAIATVQKARKTYWFEKYLWSISSDNYLIIGGRDQQQNEHVVKKHLRDGDLYVHADMHGATSVIVKNPAGTPVPPRTLQEAGSMAVCYSSAWEAHITASAWWVQSGQVSKTAPSGEYLQTGSFMVRGRKNYLTPSPLVLGFAFLFKLDELSTPRHKGERQPRLNEEEASRGQEEEEEEEVPGREDSVDEVQLNESGNSENGDVPYPDTVINFQFSAKRSEVDSLTETPSEPPLPAPGYPDVKGHRHMSAKQRRDSKKQGRTAEQRPPSQADLPVTTSAPQQDTGQHMTKRDKSKHKRSKQQKYLEQDEEERRIRMDLLGASGGPRKEVEGKKKGKHKSSNPKKKYREPSKAVVPTRRRQGDPTLLLVEEAEEEEEIAVSDEDSTEDDRGLQEDEVSMATGDVSPGDIPATERVHTKDREGEESVDREEESVDREGEESVDREGEESVDREEESVDREGEESVDREGEESVDREGEESVDREGEESVDKEGEESVDREGEESVDRQEKSAVSVGEPDVGESPRDVLHAAHSVTSQGSTGKDVEEEEEDGEEGEWEDKDQLSVLDSLTGCPFEEDVLLFAIPVCAPYQALANYKYKVKLIPGTTTRGKAAKTALFHFVHSKEATNQEKNLLKSVKDTDLSRYFPGRVKMSMANKATVPRGGTKKKSKQ